MMLNHLSFQVQFLPCIKLAIHSDNVNRSIIIEIVVMDNSQFIELIFAPQIVIYKVLISCIIFGYPVPKKGLGFKTMADLFVIA